LTCDHQFLLCVLFFFAGFIHSERVEFFVVNGPARAVFVADSARAAQFKAHQFFLLISRKLLEVFIAVF